MKVEIIKDRGSYIIVRDKNWRGDLVERKIKRWRCVGGPCDGETKAVFELPKPENGHGYQPFNNAGCSSFSCIYAWLPE